MTKFGVKEIYQYLYIKVVKTDTEGHPVQGCNDCIFDFHGNLWVTAPAGKIAPEKYVRSSFEVRNQSSTKI